MPLPAAEDAEGDGEREGDCSHGTDPVWSGSLAGHVSSCDLLRGVHPAPDAAVEPARSGPLGSWIGAVISRGYAANIDRLRSPGPRPTLARLAARLASRAPEGE